MIDIPIEIPKSIHSNNVRENANSKLSLHNSVYWGFYSTPTKDRGINGGTVFRGTRYSGAGVTGGLIEGVYCNYKISTSAFGNGLPLVDYVYLTQARSTSPLKTIILNYSLI